LSDQDEHRTRELAKALPKDETQLLYSICIKGRAEIGLAPDEYSGLTMVLLRLLAFKSSGPSVSDEDGAEKKTLEFANLDPTRPSALTSSPPSPKATEDAKRPPRLESALPHVDEFASQDSHGPHGSLQPSDSDSPVSAQPSPAAPAPGLTHAGRDLPVRDMGDPHGLARPSPPIKPSSSPAFTPPQHDSTLNARLTPEPAAKAESLVAVAVRVAPQNADKTTSSSLERFKTHLKPTPMGDVWMQTVQQLMDADLVQSLSRELALQSQLVAKDEQSILLRIESETLSSPNAKERLRQALTSLGLSVELRLEMGAVSDSPAMRLAQMAYEKQQVAEAKILGDPFVLKMMQEFEATIVPGSIKSLSHTPSPRTEKTLD